MWRDSGRIAWIGKEAQRVKDDPWVAACIKKSNFTFQLKYQFTLIGLVLHWSWSYFIRWVYLRFWVYTAAPFKATGLCQRALLRKTKPTQEHNADGSTFRGSLVQVAWTWTQSLSSWSRLFPKLASQLKTWGGSIIQIWSCEILCLQTSRSAASQL